VPGTQFPARYTRVAAHRFKLAELSARKHRSEFLTWRQALAQTIVVGLALAISSCASAEKPSPATVAALRKLPEDHLFFAGSSTIGEADYSATGVDAGGAAPYAGWIMGTSALQADVLSFYQQQLGQLGWQRNDADVIRGTGETLAAGWQKQQYIFRLGFSRPGDPRNPGHGAYPTVYSISITTKI
jgi:hypothetical protein